MKRLKKPIQEPSTTSPLSSPDVRKVLVANSVAQFGQAKNMQPFGLE